jgi:hypothetical protein
MINVKISAARISKWYKWSSTMHMYMENNVTQTLVGKLEDFAIPTQLEKAKILHIKHLLRPNVAVAYKAFFEIGLGQVRVLLQKQAVCGFTISFLTGPVRLEPASTWKNK